MGLTGCLSSGKSLRDRRAHHRLFPLRTGSAGSDPLVITVPTFRRPRAPRQDAPHVDLAGQPPALCRRRHRKRCGRTGRRGAARDFFAAHEANGLVIVTRDRGNCHAYNGGWQAALDTYPMLEAIAVIDDDEVAAPDWLSRLLSVQADTKAESSAGRNCGLRGRRQTPPSRTTPSSCPIMTRRDRCRSSTPRQCADHAARARCHAAALPRHALQFHRWAATAIFIGGRS